jgi:hypothetical protein
MTIESVRVGQNLLDGEDDYSMFFSDESKDLEPFSQNPNIFGRGINLLDPTKDVQTLAQEIVSFKKKPNLRLLDDWPGDSHLEEQCSFHINSEINAITVNHNSDSSIEEDGQLSYSSDSEFIDDPFDYLNFGPQQITHQEPVLEKKPQSVSNFIVVDSKGSLRKLSLTNKNLNKVYKEINVERSSIGLTKRSSDNKFLYFFDSCDSRLVKWSVREEKSVWKYL